MSVSFLGGGGQRKLAVISPDSDGYSGQQLKGISGNRQCTLYIVPLQEEIDTTPLPPEAKEFEKMPKAPCNTCRKLVPLQALPDHIKSCKEENVDLCSSSDENYTQDDMSPLCSQSQAEMTAECPVCRGVFSINIIEIHASECGLRAADRDDNGNVSSEAMHSFQSSQDVLNWISCQVDEGSTFPLCVSRSDLFIRGMQQWQRQKKSSPKCRLKVTFFGESGIDTGALSKEFLTEMVAGIEQKLFTGSPDNKGKNPLYCLNSLDNNYFRTAGELMAGSMAQGGSLPNFMHEWCYRYLCSGDSDSIQVSTRDVTDLELSQLFLKEFSSITQNVCMCTNFLNVLIYFIKLSGVLLRNLLCFRAIVLHSTMRLVPMLDQLRKGLQLYDLLEVLKTHPDLCLPLFVPGEDDKVDAAFILEKCQPDFSEKGSVKYSREVNIMNFLQDFLQKTEDCGMFKLIYSY
ncbi:uncharacterized protein LOC125897975 [Epinephelus fuscoguttatus]|uniref:uncharacterized protein LOC125897975 n=1 Tax=Epinephelus fuscoguttatus TaxID=293821 RepID=UPI0020D0F3FB|nr:uncharacterized protein LOC125897975 [Epinephelus fuscoguttatus]